VQQNETGFVFPAGCERIRTMGEKAFKRMAQWSPETNMEATIQAIDRAIEHKLGAARSVNQ